MKAEILNLNYAVVHFEDHGQDFLHWVINTDRSSADYGRIVYAGPFQSSVWKGCLVNLNTVKTGEKLQFISRFDDEILELNYRVERIRYFGRQSLRQIEEAITAHTQATKSLLSVCKEFINSL